MFGCFRLGFVGSVGSVCGALSAVSPVAEFCGAKLGWGGIVSIRRFNARNTLK